MAMPNTLKSAKDTVVELAGYDCTCPKRGLFPIMCDFCRMVMTVYKVQQDAYNAGARDMGNHIMGEANRRIDHQVKKLLQNKPQMEPEEMLKKVHGPRTPLTLHRIKNSIGRVYKAGLWSK